MLAEVEDGDVTTSLGDVSGTPIGHVAATGGLRPAAPHGPSGERVSGAAAAARGWQGRPEDASGLRCFRGGYYDPASGRFTSEDPWRIAGGGASFYVFGGGDPINRMDPTGLSWMPHIPFPIPGLPPCTASDACYVQTEVCSGICGTGEQRRRGARACRRDRGQPHRRWYGRHQVVTSWTR